MEAEALEAGIIQVLSLKSKVLSDWVREKYEVSNTKYEKSMLLHHKDMAWFPKRNFSESESISDPVFDIKERSDPVSCFKEH